MTMKNSKRPARTLAIAALLCVPLYAGCAPQPAVSSAETATVDPGSKYAPGLGDEQLRNAACIVAAANDLGLNDQAKLIGVMTALGESGLTVLDYGDEAGPDSRGLFQQRDNGFWGTLEERMDPYRSAHKFLSVLKELEGWEQLEPSEAAHRVQINADPDHYTRFIPTARFVLSLTASVPDISCTSTGG